MQLIIVAQNKCSYSLPFRIPTPRYVEYNNIVPTTSRGGFAFEGQWFVVE